MSPTPTRRRSKTVTLPDGRRARVPDVSLVADGRGGWVPSTQHGQITSEPRSEPKQQFPHSHHRIAARIREAGESARL